MSQIEQALETEVLEILEFLDKFVIDVDALSAKLRADLKAREGEIRLLGMGQTQAAHTYEVLKCCLPAWLSLSGRYPSQESFELEFRDRILVTLRQQFIATMSAVEFCARETVEMAPDSPLAAAIGPMKRRDVYLLLIMQKSHRVRLVSGIDLDTWKTLIMIRNMLVHNNGFADTAATNKVAGETLILVPGKMTEIDTFLSLPKFTQEAVLKYHKWLRFLFGIQRQ